MPRYHAVLTTALGVDLKLVAALALLESASTDAECALRHLLELARADIAQLPDAVVA